MRARYEAFKTFDFDFLESTATDNRPFDDDVREVLRTIQWVRLNVLQAHDDVVEFEAFYIQAERPMVHHETSWFVQQDGQWLYDKGDYEIRVLDLGRNDPCLCGSGKKFKKCCARN